MWKRPKKEDTEDDILKEQQLFLARKQRENEFKPAASVHGSGDEPNKSTNDDDKPETTLSLNLEIVERNVSKIPFPPFCKGAAGGFPRTSKIDKRNLYEGGSKNISIFLQQMKHKEIKQTAFKTKNVTASLIDGSGLKDFTDAESEVRKIHEENMDVLKKMTPEEITETRQQLLNELDPKLIDFLTNKRKNIVMKEDASMEVDINIDESKAAIDLTSANEDISHIPISLHEVEKNKWLNMNVVEQKKLEWMKPIDEKTTEIPAKLSVNARFQFDGTLLEAEKSYPINSGLFNHANEPERAGYSLDELFTFVQSSLPSQRVLGLQTLANILEKVHKGYYDSVFVNSLQEELLSNTDILLIVRTCLDDTSDTILAASVYCLHGLVCNTVIDELYLDRIFACQSSTISHISVIMPQLAPLIASDANIEELTDSQLVRQDAIRGLLRTDILPRIRYLMNHFVNRQNDKLITENLFDVLIRIARHSVTAARAIFDCDYLIETIVENYLPVKVTFEENRVIGNPSAKVLKLLRIMISSDVQLSDKLFASFPQLWSSMQIYISIDPFTLNHKTTFSSIDCLKVSIEAMRLWCVLMAQNSRGSVEKFEALFPLLIKQVQFCSTLKLSHRHSFDWHYAATLLSCLACLNCPSEVHRGLSSVVKTVTFQWIREMINDNLIPNVDVINTIAIAVYYLSKIGFREDIIENFAKPLLNSDSLTQKFISRLLKCSSVLYCHKNEKARLRRDAKCLPSLHFVYVADEEMKSNVLFEEESVFSLFVTLITVLESAESSLIEKFLMNTTLLNYIDSVASNFITHEFNYLERLEINSLAALINLSSSVNTSVQVKYHNLSLNILCCVSNEYQQGRLVDVVFDRSIYNQYLDVNLSLMAISELENSVIEYIKFLPQVKDFYLKSTTFKTPLWIYDPIVHFFSSGNSDASVVTLVLRYFVILANYNESYLMNICSLSVHFAEIATVFLLSNDVFFEKPVEQCLRFLLKKFVTLNISLKSSTECVPHSSTLINFFDLFVNHFEFASYGNALFANYLLVFLQQNCDTTFKKKLLTENAYALRAIFMPFTELILDIEKLLFPVETDAEIIELSLRCLLSRIVTPEINKLVYFISIHHIHHALIRNPGRLMETQPKTYRKLIRSVEMTTNERLREHIMRYSHYDSNESVGFVCGTC